VGQHAGQAVRLDPDQHRPAAAEDLVQADFLNGIIDDTILVQITSRRHSIPGTEVEIGPAVETASGLSRLCYASCMNILTRDQALVGRTIGYLSNTVMQEIGNCLKTVLQLP
jgi:mRNA-degrading endonuclease toxin of MazEF toxin-antitoxin module